MLLTSSMTSLNRKTRILICVCAIVVLMTAIFYSIHIRKPKVIISKLDTQIALLEKQVQIQPTDIRGYIVLSNDYIQKVRETTDTSYYTKIDALMDTANTIDPKSPYVPFIRAQVAASRHQFKDALQFSKQAIGLSPETPGFYGPLGDSYLELGRYAEAVTAFQTMVNKKPDFSSYSRIAYIRELYGDVSGATEALQSALRAGATFPENIAWAYTELGKLTIRTDIDLAEQQFTTAINAVSTFAPALEGLGRIAFAKGDTTKAIELFQKAIDVSPLAQYVIDLGNVYDAMGNTTRAQQQYALAKISFGTSNNNKVDTNLEMAIFLADHDLDLPDALTKGKLAYQNRPSIYGADAYAWALYKNKQPKIAQQYIKQALRLGENDPLIIFHAGMIAKDLGNIKEAKRLLTKALALNPYFSIKYSGQARETLQHF